MVWFRLLYTNSLNILLNNLKFNFYLGKKCKISLVQHYIYCRLHAWTCMFSVVLVVGECRFQNFNVFITNIMTAVEHTSTQGYYISYLRKSENAYLRMWVCADEGLSKKRWFEIFLVNQMIFVNGKIYKRNWQISGSSTILLIPAKYSIEPRSQHVSLPLLKNSQQ